MLEEITQFKDSYSSSPSMSYHNLLNLYNHEFLAFISNFYCFLVVGKLVIKHSSHRLYVQTYVFTRFNVSE